MHYHGNSLDNVSLIVVLAQDISCLFCMNVAIISLLYHKLPSNMGEQKIRSTSSCKASSSWYSSLKSANVTGTQY